ncbi:MAG: GntR family transcriptional regulator [Chloroflexota bacterium]
MIDMALDRRIPVPLYYQLQQQLRQAILDGRLAPGASLPPEPDLAISASVSRFTVRQAVEQLVREGLVRRERGRGTFVSDLADSAHGINGFQFAHAVDRDPKGVSIRVLQSRIVPAPDVLRQLLPQGTLWEAHEISRIHESRQQPMALETMHVPTALIQDSRTLDLQAVRLQPMLEQQCGVRISHAEESLRAVIVSGETARLLDLKEGAAAFQIERRSWAGANLIEVSSIMVPGQFGLSRVLESSAQLTIF